MGANKRHFCTVRVKGKPAMQVDIKLFTAKRIIMFCSSKTYVQMYQGDDKLKNCAETVE